MSTMTFTEFHGAYRYLERHEGLILPHGIRPGGLRPNHSESYPRNPAADKATWDAYQWNPPQYAHEGWQTVDPDASPKPTYADLLRALTLHNAERNVEWAEAAMIDSAEYRAELTDKDVLPVGGDVVRVNDGLDHMTGLLQMVEHGHHGRAAPAPYHPPGWRQGAEAALDRRRQARGLGRGGHSRESRRECARDCSHEVQGHSGQGVG